MNTPKLPPLPCPFCGNEPKVVDDLITFHVECTNCGSTGSVSSYESGAISEWNRRAAIETQGVPDGYERSISQKVFDCHMQKKAILQAVARGWCSPENADKEMDTALAEAIASEVISTLASAPSAPQADSTKEQS